MKKKANKPCFSYMLTNNQLDTLNVLKCALCDNKAQVSNNFDVNDIKDIIINHNLASLFHFGLTKLKKDEPDWLKESFFNNTYHLSLIDKCYKDIENEFNKNSIKYVSLKGIASRNKYPNKLMRYMSDIDIFIDVKEYKHNITPIMNKLGYLFCYDTDHEYVYKNKDNIVIELHKRLIPSYNKDFYKVIGGDGWKWINENPNRNGFIYSFIHFAKHYRDSGIGLNHLVDLFVIWEDNLEETFKEFHLDEFYINIKSVLDFIFNNKDMTGKDEFIINYIFKCGMYGTTEHNIESNKLKHIKYSGNNSTKAKTKRIFKRLFPSYKWMSNKYKFLIKLPFLLPIMWIFRIISIPFSKHSKDELNDVLNMDKDIYEYEENLKYVGLNYFNIRK